ncbi:acetate/propionate family kinase [Lacticaseibacillus sp. GG6-2]
MSEKILAINAGSSSLKFKLYDMPSEKVIISGLFERIGEAQPELRFGQVVSKPQLRTHKEAVAMLLAKLTEMHVVASLDEIVGVGHRVAHGGELFKQSSIVTAKECQQIASLNELAPLHNPINLEGIRSFMVGLPQAVQVAVFDTSFHQTMPPEHYLYPLPYRYYREAKVRKYGFHGTSHRFVAKTAADVLGLDVQQANFVTCHLGNGSSICCVANGQSIDTSMGFTPTAGLMMGTRCGDIDPMTITYLQRKYGLDAAQLDAMMTQESGLLGVSEVSNDLRDVLAAVEAGKEQARIAVAMFVQRIQKYILTYRSQLQRLDGLVFTAGIGERSAIIREQICAGLACLGIRLDPDRNATNETRIDATGSSVPVLVIPTDEELVIARDTYRLKQAAVTQI